jgi:hypothetical protein
MNTITDPQAVRQQRAQEQASDYIITPHWTDRDAFTVIGKRGQCYDVTPEGCNCPDAMRRSEGHCKHWHLCRAHVAKLVEQAEAGKKREQVRRQMEQDFPNY